jgi:hypothetical protein
LAARFLISGQYRDGAMPTDREHPNDDAVRHVVLDTHIIVGRQRIVDALPVNAYAKSGCPAAPASNATLI